jgi:hypothetical protein
MAVLQLLLLSLNEEVYRRVAAGPFLVNKFSSCTLLQLFQVEIISKLIVSDKVVRYKNKPDLQSFYK